MLHIACHRRFTANHTWHVNLGNHRLFVKLNPHREEAAEEIRGHERLRDHYPIPSLVTHRRLGRWTLLAYQRHDGIGLNRGLLLDEITHADLTGDFRRLNTCLDAVLDHYRTVIHTSLTLEQRRHVVGKLYAQRAAHGGRLDTYYGADQPWLIRANDLALRPSELARTALVVNGRRHHIYVSALFTNLRRHFAPDRPVFAAVTQGDPTDINLGWHEHHGPVWFDYDTAGHNALAGEFACFLAYQCLHGAWLTPTYHPAAFTDHPAALTARKLSRPAVHVDIPDRHTVHIDYWHRLSPARRLVLHRYLHELVHPTAAQLGIPDVLDWLRPYLLMRILGVYNIAELALPDAALSLGLLADTLHPDTRLEELLGLTHHPVRSST